MIEVIEVTEDDAAYPIELFLVEKYIVERMSKEDAVQLIAALQKVVDNLE